MSTKVYAEKWLVCINIRRVDKGKYNVMSSLKTMLRYAWRNEDLPKVSPIPKLSYKLPEIEYLTIEQQESILKAFPKKHGPISIYDGIRRPPR